MRQLQVSDINLRGIRAVVFDLDGTLYDKRTLKWRMVRTNLGHLQLLAAERKSVAALRGRCYGSGAEFYKALFEAISSRCSVTIAEVREWYMYHYLPDMVTLLKKHCKVAPYAPPLLAALRQRGIRLAVFSDYGCVEQKLEALGLQKGAFDALFSAPDMGGLKPCTVLFEKVLSELGVQPSEALMIGDREDTDGEGARAVGMRFINVI